MLGQPLSMLVPQVVGFRLTGALPRGRDRDRPRADGDASCCASTGVVGKFVEYFGAGRRRARARRPRDAREHVARVRRDVRLLPGRRRDARLPAPDRPRRASASRSSRRTARRTCSGTSPTTIPTYSQVVELDLADVEPSLAGPRRPQDRVPLASREGGVHRVARHVRRRLHERHVRQGGRRHVPGERPDDRAAAGGVRAGAGARATAPSRRQKPGARRRRGLRARARLRRDRRDHLVHEHVEPVGDDRRRPAREEGGRARPDAQAVGEVVARAGLEGRHRVLRARRPRHATSTSSASTSSATAARRASATRGRCPTRSRPRSTEGDLVVCAVLSGNRNFEARIHPDVKANYLASPPLVVAYALAGPDGHRPRDRAARRRTTTATPSSCATSGRRGEEIDAHDRRLGRGRDVRAARTPTSSTATTAGARSTRRRATSTRGSPTSTYVRQPPFFDGHDARAGDRSPTSSARACLVSLGDSVTTDHISPAGAIRPDSPGRRVPRRARRRARATSTRTARAAATTR